MKYNSKQEFELEPATEIDKKGNQIQTYQVDDIILSSNDLKNGVKIKWFADDTDFEIWFPKEWTDVLFPWHQSGSAKRSSNKRLTIKFRGKLRTAKKSETVIYYSIYCSKTQSMAIGNSSPRMLIRS